MRISDWSSDVCSSDLRVRSTAQFSISKIACRAEQNWIVGSLTRSGWCRSICNRKESDGSFKIETAFGLTFAFLTFPTLLYVSVSREGHLVYLETVVHRRAPAVITSLQCNRERHAQNEPRNGSA